jgi:predicted dienelactone hydrolase
MLTTLTVTGSVLLASWGAFISPAAAAGIQDARQAVPPYSQAAAPASPPRPPVASFSRLSVADGGEPSIEVGVWRPAGGGGGRRPLVVLSHGNGGDFRSHHDTAEALAAAGFVVASLTHTGDNWRDQSRATDLANRTRQLSVLIDHMVSEWQGRDSVDPQRIGAFGFSAGGFTVLAAAGGKPDLARLSNHCREHPDFFDCRLISRHGDAVRKAAQHPQRLSHDARIKALVVAAPALGFTFTREGLSGVTQPVQLWQAGDDRILPSPFYAEAVQSALPRPPEHHRVDRAGHFDFLPPCSPALAANAPMICAPTPGFDRARFHDRLNAEIVRFFTETL